MARNIIITESQFKRLITEALAIEPYLDSIWELSEKLNNIFKDFDVKGWDYTPNLFGCLGDSYMKPVGSLGDTTVCALVVGNNDINYRGGFVPDLNTIFVTYNGDDTRTYFDTLAHELTHKIDTNNSNVKMRTFDSMSMFNDFFIPREIAIILYQLWDNTEFNAHQTIILSNNLNLVKKRVNFLKTILNEISSYDEDSPMWRLLGARYLNIRNWDAPKIKKYFISKSYKLLKSFTAKVYRKFSKYNADDNRFVAESSKGLKS